MNLIKIYIGLSLILIFGGIFSFLCYSFYVVTTKDYTYEGIKILYICIFIAIIGIVLLVLPISCHKKVEVVEEK